MATVLEAEFDDVNLCDIIAANLRVNRLTTNRTVYRQFRESGVFVKIKNNAKYGELSDARICIADTGFLLYQDDGTTEPLSTVNYINIPLNDTFGMVFRKTSQGVMML